MDQTLGKERMNEIIEAMMKVARGDYSVRVELSGKNDDLDALAMGLNMMIDDIRNGIEELRRANEKLQASEEELRAFNEELEASNEELRSTEEELRASNEELEAANEELRAAQERCGHHKVISINKLGKNYLIQ